MRANRVPVEPFLKIIERWIKSQDDMSFMGQQSMKGPLYVLSENLGLCQDTIPKWQRGLSKTIDFNLADKLLCKTNNINMWQDDPELHEIYYSTPLVDKVEKPEVKQKRCKRLACPNWFKPHKHQIYCSPECGFANRKQHTPRAEKYRSISVVCRNGHRRTSQNTRMTERGSAVCKTCKAENTRASRLRKAA